MPGGSRQGTDPAPGEHRARADDRAVRHRIVVCRPAGGVCRPAEGCATGRPVRRAGQPVVQVTVAGTVLAVVQVPLKPNEVEAPAARLPL